MNNVGIYQTEKFTAYIYHTKIVICTKYQSFKIVYEDRTGKAWLKKLKADIRLGTIKTVSDMPAGGKSLLWQNCSRPH